MEITDSAIAELVRDRHPDLDWTETHLILRTFVHLAFIKISQDDDYRQQQMYTEPEDVQALRHNICKWN
jgi:hypothetical protein